MKANVVIQGELEIITESVDTIRRKSHLKDAEKHLHWLENDADPDWWYYELDMKSTKRWIACLEGWLN